MQFIYKSFCVYFVCMHGSDHADWLETKKNDLPFGHEPVSACSLCGCDGEGKRQRQIRIQKHNYTHLLLIGESTKEPKILVTGNTKIVNENIHWDCSERNHEVSIPPPYPHPNPFVPWHWAPEIIQRHLQPYVKDIRKNGHKHIVMG